MHIHNLCSAYEKDQPKGINRIHNVSNKVDTGHERNDHIIIPFAGNCWCAGVGPFLLEAVKWPNDHSCHVHQHRQHVATCQDFVKRYGEESQNTADGKNDDNDGKNEANGIDSDAPLEPWKFRELLVVQANEDDAGHKGLQNLEEAWNGGQKSTDLTTSSSG